ncbi:MAG: hypothetical protein ACLUD0_07290 [Eubacterium ramulus]
MAPFLSFLMKNIRNWKLKLDRFATRYEQLIYLNQELCRWLENGISLDLLARLLSTQLVTKGEKLICWTAAATIINFVAPHYPGRAGKREFRTDLSVNEMVKLYAVAERALLYDWCICRGGVR